MSASNNAALARARRLPPLPDQQQLHEAAARGLVDEERFSSQQVERAMQEAAAEARARVEAESRNALFAFRWRHQTQQARQARQLERQKYPDTWRMSQPGRPEHGRFELPADSREFQDVAASFMRTMQAGVRIVSIERVQNVSLWRSYDVWLKNIVSREKEQDESRPESRFERVCLFHGCRPDVVPKIVEQGFNRSFCGRNATVYGKGVYFARDASYSALRRYSTPDAHGHQHIFACRVVVGEYCLGKCDALTPDERSGNTLYDSTVDDLRSPSIFVTYHDAQAYPEFLIKFACASTRV